MDAVAQRQSPARKRRWSSSVADTPRVAAKADATAATGSGRTTGTTFPHRRPSSVQRDGTLESIAVREGQSVEKGAIVFRLTREMQSYGSRSSHCAARRDHQRATSVERDR